ncbi:MAG: tetratricopeptide repeat protein [Oscillospiraceae bacterium]|jgi:tetratricopeptide (TPR) repeat protein|nr:tetratricopeptide repeat protein [Oscillospiraceae bacterium]
MIISDAKGNTLAFLARTGRQQEGVERCERMIKEEPPHPRNYVLLASAYSKAGEEEKALCILEDGLRQFPDHAILMSEAGDRCKALKKFDQALHYWEQSSALDPEAIDTRYATAFYLMEQGKNREAEKVWEQIIAWLLQRGFDVQSQWPMRELEKLRQKTE